ATCGPAGAAAYTEPQHVAHRHAADEREREAARVHETLQKEIDVERTAHVAALGAAQEERQRLQTSIQDLEGKIQQSESARGATGAELAREQDQTQRLESRITDLQ